MGKTTGISWTDHTFNPWWGCTRVSPGCDNCYAETFDKRNFPVNIGTVEKPEYTAKHWGKGSERRLLSDKYWREPLKWNRDALNNFGRRARPSSASVIPTQVLYCTNVVTYRSNKRMAPTAMKSKLGGASAPAAAGISLAPSTFVEGGGLVGDVDVEVVDAQFVMFDYNGNVAVPVPALGLSLKELSGEGKTHDQYFSCGDAEQFAPSDDGSALIPTGDRTSINSSCKAGMFLISMVNAGVPETLLASGNIKDIIGLKVHVIRVASPKRAGLTNQKEGATDLTVSKLIALPGEKVAPKTGLGVNKAPAKMNGALAAPTPTAATSAEVDSTLAEATAEAIITVLAENDGTVLLKDISAKLFKSIDKSNPLRAGITKLAFDKNWLASVSGEAGFQFDGTTLSM